ncbi:MAG: UDP-N-acetylmuramate--L-alanine ligase [Bacteroidales bacterium]|nr:UDP-N-acetylmuramate--L-alanine ligase [Bacteroidales bacterium]
MKTVNSVYFLGIGGIGMSALARYFNFEGKTVAGYDRTPSPLTDRLSEEGISIHYTDSVDLIPSDIDLIVYTPAIPSEQEEFKFLKKSSIPMLKRSEVLGEISKDYYTIAIAGTHGKTTITSMVAQILKHNGVAVNAFIGGIANNFNSNLLLSKNAEVMVVEADEFDRSFLTLHPDMAIISSMDADHLDIYSTADYLKKSFFMFSGQIKGDGWLISQSRLDIAPEFSGKSVSYSATDDADYCASNLSIDDGRTVFDLQNKASKIARISLQLPGNHNIENAIAASVAALKFGLSAKQVADGLRQYLGVRRRFEFLIHTDKLVMIDDYAHHPTEIRACLQAVRSLFPNKKVTGVFQPHLFSRTRDFMDDFAQSLSQLDELLLLDIYPAREKPIAGVSSAALLEKVRIENKQLCKKDELVNCIDTKNIEVLIMMGAGDIDRILQTVKSKLS